MASPLGVFVGGVTGVFVVMIVLLVGINISSKIAIWLENRNKQEEKASAKG